MADDDIRIRELGAPGDLGWVVLAHGEVYAEEFGWTTEFEALVARIVADYAAERDPAREAAWIAERGGRRVGCVFCVADPDDARAARLRILLVHPDGRGRGLGGRLVDTCIAFARDTGYERVRLVTPASELEQLAAGEAGGSGELVVEARRDGVLCKGRVLLRRGALTDVEIQPAYKLFP